MATQQLVVDNKQGAEIYHGADICKKKCHELLDELNLPRGLLPLDNLTEMGHNRTNGFVWLKQNKRYEHKFHAIGETVAYETEVTAFIENRRIRKINGIKSRALLMWMKVAEMSTDDASPEKVKVTSSVGISMTYPVTAFELEKKDKK